MITIKWRLKEWESLLSTQKEVIKKHIHDVNYSSNISQNLFNVGQMMMRGYKLIFDDGRCEIFDKKSSKKSCYSEVEF